MKLITELYINQKERLPLDGQKIIGQYNHDSIIVYQAFNPLIADYAIKNQTFGGQNYSFQRMSWIKPNFLWMMFRCGWAQKENQERVLAIRIKIKMFEKILNEAVFSIYKNEIYQTHEQWNNDLKNSEVRLQWDPDHDPFGNKLNRRAIQLGLKGNILKDFCENGILEIIDITEFVQKEYAKLNQNDLNGLLVPVENILEISESIKSKILIN